MKTLNFLFLLCFALLITSKASAQEKHDGISQAEYDKSLAAFTAAKEKHGNSYSFSLTTGSFTGYMTTTTMVVKNGKVVERHFESKHEYYKDRVKKWKEVGKEVGQHKDEGKAPITLDDIYVYAKGFIKSDKPRRSNTDLDFFEIDYYFSIDKDGIISNASTRPRNCMDDCTRGYSIVNLKWGKK
jgi:hypothetical protein